ncbi:MAG: hypothetical protein IJU19_04150 [Bacteroidales bacterium]|nr:hypothetical protein [Bacteroidales bacterium]
MKKCIVGMLLVGMVATGAMAQNAFKGVIKYKVESTGQVDMTIPAEAAVAEIKVMGEDLFTKSAIFMEMMEECVVVNGLKSTHCVNFAPLLGFLRGQGSEFTYQGDGKILVREEVNQSMLDSLEIVDTEPGHFYLEYTSETREIVGVQARKVVRHQYNDEGTDHPVEMWVGEGIGPKYNMLFNGIKGMPLQCTMDMGEGKAITYIATEVVKGKVKEADFLLPDGYEELSREEMEQLGSEIREELELLQGE